MFNPDSSWCETASFHGLLVGIFDPGYDRITTDRTWWPVTVDAILVCWPVGCQVLLPNSLGSWSLVRGLAVDVGEAE